MHDGFCDFVSTLNEILKILLPGLHKCKFLLEEKGFPVSAKLLKSTAIFCNFRKVFDARPKHVPSAQNRKGKEVAN